MSGTSDAVMAETVQRTTDQWFGVPQRIPGGVEPERSAPTDTAQAHEIQVRIARFETGAVRT